METVKRTPVILGIVFVLATIAAFNIDSVGQNVAEGSAWRGSAISIAVGSLVGLVAWWALHRD
jgi:hypothetical protein